MDEITKIYQTINALSKKVNSNSLAIDSLMEHKTSVNAESAADAQKAIIELDEILDERLADIENALCELTEEE